MITSGSCHCGNISFALDWRDAAPRIAARSCTCSFCRKHGGTWSSCPVGALEITVKDPAQVSDYAFGTRAASATGYRTSCSVTYHPSESGPAIVRRSVDPGMRIRSWREDMNRTI
ncbi:hypothetical protein [Burkholderia ubonensis]|uniref:hypothetical protein n=1 Tax=Burkholderia ubonensis TaxID=101571 RepID=UPI000AC25754|nr:hypothetical protein [Burkholderia ubonensis]